MTWADKLFKNKIRIGNLQNAFKLPTGHYIGKTDGLKEINIINLNDLVLAVLEKNKEIEIEDLQAQREVRNTGITNFFFREDSQACAWREIVEVCQTNRNTQQGTKKCEEVKK